MDIVIVLILTALAYKFLQDKRSVVARKYDVFLSFRGPDTRTGFADFLYNSLVAAGFHVFRDNEELPVGEKIGAELLRAIRNCRIAIPIISEQYAQSKSCLRELTEIMDCYKKHAISVFPIFYKVDAVDVLNERGKFGKAFQAMQCRPKEKPERNEWKKALQSVARIKGWTSETIANGHEGELVIKVVTKVSSEWKTKWIERLPVFPILMSNYHVRAVYSHFLEKKRREVYLAFRGPDTGNGFAAYLYISLLNKGIRVFSFDDPSLIGTNFAHEIRNAIDQCKISIPILSENYASSTWCLDELAQMVECKKNRGQMIMPIFYKVDPSHVKDRSHCFEEKMLRHQRRVKEDIYKQWDQALKEVGSSKGWESNKIANGYEGLLVKQVVNEVLRFLKNPEQMTRGSAHAAPLSL